ncbi:MAG: hypothetical protein OXP09_10915 [Gammaproteobacteria bacterium]|nr:hypothetical protein [Gammaproteobacteria bacterium]
MPRPTPLLLCLVASLAVANDPDLSPRTWPDGELERYENLFGAEKPLAESKTGIVVSTTAAAAARAGLEALNRGGSAVDAVMTHALAEITLWASCCVSHAGFMDLMVFEAAAGGWRGYWVGIHIDPETGIRRGAVSPYFDGWALGQDD